MNTLIRNQIKYFDTFFRSMKKDEKDKANERKMSPAPIRLSRPKTAPAKSKKVKLDGKL